MDFFRNDFVKYLFIFTFILLMCFASVHKSAAYTFSAIRGQQRALSPQKQSYMRGHMCARNETPGPLQEQHVLINTDPPLQSRDLF